MQRFRHAECVQGQGSHLLVVWLGLVLCGLLGCTRETPDQTAFASGDGAVVDAGSGDGLIVDDTGDGIGSDDANVDDSHEADQQSLDGTDAGQTEGSLKDTAGCAKAADCDDGKLCTTDLCNPSDGTCSHKANAAACDDGDPCTLGDQCEALKCVGKDDRYFRRLLIGAGAFTGGSSALADGLLALAGRRNDKPVVVGLDSAHKQAWIAKVGSEAGSLRAIVAAKSGGYVVGGHQDTALQSQAKPLIAHVGATGTLLKTGTAAVSEAWASVSGLVTADKKSQMFFVGSSIDGEGKYKAFYGQFNLVQGKIDGKVTTLGTLNEQRAANGIIQVGTRNVVYGWSAFVTGKKGWLYALDRATGFKAFEVTHGHTNADQNFSGAAAMPDKGLLVVGSSNWGSSGFYDAWVVRTDGQGKKLWARMMGTDASDAAMGVLAVADGAFVIGRSNIKSGAQGLNTIWRIDTHGTPWWSKTYNSSGNEYSRSISRGADALLLTGYRVAGKDSQLVVMALDEFGHNSCGASGVCAGKLTTDCKDGNPCTADNCESAAGCSHASLPDTSACGDGKACNATGQCLP
ncbi:MAG: hypothetical protein KC502_12835 [Myxococcales bacterium]|nr:hypothetical protein [Myxococcales bacterium]